MLCGPFFEKLRCTLAQQDAKKTSSAARRLAEKDSHTHLLSTFPPHLRRILEASSEKGSSSWLTALPLTSHGFALHKGDFRDALCLHFGWQPSSLPLVCICGKPFTVEHALRCSCGGYTSIRHNELQDITATLLTEVSNNVGIEPVLQKLSGEHLTQKNISHLMMLVLTSLLRIFGGIIDKRLTLMCKWPQFGSVSSLILD